MSTNVLSDRDANVQLKPSPSPEKQKPKSLEYHREMLQSRLKSGQTQQYISPSDEIMSPASQKLTNFKNKRALKKAKPQTLFKKTSTKNFETAAKTAMFADIPKNAPQEGDEDKAEPSQHE